MATKRTAPSNREAGPPPAKRRTRDVDPLPDNPLQFGKRKEPHDTIQISCWNVAGLATCNSKKWDYGFRHYVEAEDPTILAITEVNEKDPESVFENSPDFEFLRARYPYRYWAPKVAIVSKIAPIADSVFGFPEGRLYDMQGAESRALTLEFKECFLLATYVPNSGTEFKRLPERENWAKDFEVYIRSLDARKPVIWTGDFNVIRTTTPTSSVSNDIQWDQNLGKHAGTHKVERYYHERLLGPQPELENPRRPGPLFVDVWRFIHGPETRNYTYYGKKMGGWRLDGFIVSERFLYRVRKCLIRYEVKNKFWPAEGVVGLGALSDHWPVLLSLEMAEL